MGRQGVPLGDVQEIQIWLYEQMVYAQPSTCPRKLHAQTPMGLWHTNGSPNLDKKTRLYNNQQRKKKKEKLWTLLSRLKVEKKKKRKKKIKDKYFDFARELKKLWNMKVTIIPIVIGAFGTVTKELLKQLEDLEIRGRVETIQTTTWLRMGRILRRVLENWRDLQSLILQRKTIS